MNKKWIYYVAVSILVLIFVIACVGLCEASENQEPVEPTEYPEQIWTNKMHWAHDIAEQARSMGFDDDSALIKELSDLWWREYNDLCIVAKVIEGEAGGCGYAQMVYTGVTVVNRARSEKYFADTIYDVVASPGQYSLLYLKNFHTIQPRCWMAAKDAMDGNHDAPSDLYWEALFPQGKETWKIIHFESKYYKSDTYFCRGTIYD